MAQSADLGTKYNCFKCECKFYDLGSPEPICPRCGADQRENPNAETPAPPPPKKRARKAAVAKPKATPDLSNEEEEGSLLDDNFDEESVEEGLAGAVAERLPDDSKESQ